VRFVEAEMVNSTSWMFGRRRTRSTDICRRHSEILETTILGTCKAIYKAGLSILSINSRSLLGSHVFTRCMNLCFVPSHAVRSVAIQRRGPIDVWGGSLPLDARAQTGSHEHRMARSIVHCLSLLCRPSVLGEVQNAFRVLRAFPRSCAHSFGYAGMTRRVLGLC